MKGNLHVRVLSFAVLQEIEGAHTDEDFVALLAAMEFGDTAGASGDELRELCVMALQDRRPEEAAALVLEHDMGDVLRDGQIRNLSEEMFEDKLWEQYSDMSLHERLFNVGSLLYAAFPRAFSTPDAVRVTLEVSAANQAGRNALAHASHESFLVRLVADGMDDSAVLHRMFGERLDSKSFPEADTIVWTAQVENVDADTVRIDLLSSGYWLDALRDTRSYESTAYPDEIGLGQRG